MVLKNILKLFSPFVLQTIGEHIASELIPGLRPRFYALHGKNALVTGGGRGLGLEIARQLVAKGAHVAIVARDPAELERAVTELSAARGSSDIRVIGEVCDLLNLAAIDGMLEKLRAKLGPIDVLVNNAGMIQVGPLDSMTVTDFDDAMKLHFAAPLRLMLGVREHMRTRGGGRIANVSSVGGLVAVPHLLPYSASKFALVGLSQGMSAELARDNISVSTVTPGLMRTGSPRNATFKGDHEQEYAWFAISDSLPLLSMSSSRAARRIVRALELGESHVVLGMPAQVARLANGLAPSAVTRALMLADALLPRGNDRSARRGADSQSPLAPSFLTALTERAAQRNNEM
jgi:NAD(P)-dependent dehydrogenase (short-subunit alcohol dehydrogenase family)